MIKPTYFILALLAVCSCGGSESTTGAGAAAGAGGTGAGGGITGAPVSQADFGNALASAVCDHVGACCMQYGVPFDAATCKSTAQAQGAQLAMVDPASTAFDPQAAGDCLAQISAVLQGCVYTGTDNPIPACDRMLVGVLPLGASCTSSDQCMSGDCGYPDFAMPGAVLQCITAAVRSHGHAGDPCSSTCTEEPGGGTACAATGSAGAGGADGPGGSGGAPAQPVDCYTNDNLYCGTTQKTCSVLPAVGAACADGQCQAGAYCDTLGTGLCALAQGNNPCSNDSECAMGSYCPLGMPTFNGCSPRLADGAACTNGGGCLSGGCNSGLCGPPTVASTRTCSGDLFH
jgi:hypothetical protein